MTLTLTLFLFCFLLSFVAFAILLPLEYGLRSSAWTILPKLGVAVRRLGTQDGFDVLRKRARSHPRLCVCDLDENRFLVSKGSVRCLAERSADASRTAVVFRYPLGLPLFVISAAAGATLPFAIDAFKSMSVGEAAFVTVFLSLFWGTLGAVFLLAFRAMAKMDADKLSYLLGLPLDQTDGVLFKRLRSTRRVPQAAHGQAGTLEYRRNWSADFREILIAVVFVPTLTTAMVLFPFVVDFGDSLFHYVFGFVFSIIGLVLSGYYLRQLHECYRVRRDFTFSVTSEFVACECPSPERGDSFKLSLGDIKEIRRDPGPNESERCVVIDRFGEVHEITHSYRNPVGRILDTIESVSPATPIFEFGIPRHAYATKNRPELISTQ